MKRGVYLLSASPRIKFAIPAWGQICWSRHFGEMFEQEAEDEGTSYGLSLHSSQMDSGSVKGSVSLLPWNSKGRCDPQHKRWTMRGSWAHYQTHSSTSLAQQLRDVHEVHSYRFPCWAETRWWAREGPEGGRPGHGMGGIRGRDRHGMGALGEAESI